MIHRKPRFYILITLLFFIIASSIIIITLNTFQLRKVDVVAAKRISKEASIQYPNLAEGDYRFSPYEFCIIDLYGNLLYQTSEYSGASMNEAIANNYSVLDIVVDEQLVGNALIDTSFIKDYSILIKRIQIFIISLLALLITGPFIYSYYLNKTIIIPFNELQYFAREVASGNLDSPLHMDKKNIFGAFTESFDLMRNELAVAKQKEYLANQSKKELVASLSHDIKTPVTSIKLTSELLMVIVQEDKIKSKIETIYENAEHINILVSDLFHSTLEDLGALKISPSEYYSSLLTDLIDKADYKDKVTLTQIPDCILWIDSVRIQQIISNIIYNSYKYADTDITIKATLNTTYLELTIKDYGPGVSPDELPLLFNKFYRGQNAAQKIGTGLGLYITKQLLNAMEGDIIASNEADGFLLTVLLKLAI